MKLDRFILAFVVVLVNAVPLAAQMELSFSGYAADVASFQISSVEGIDNAYVNLTRVRLRPTLQLWEGGSVVLEHEIDALLSSGDRRSSFVVPDVSNRQAVDLRWHLSEDKHTSLVHYVDRLYVRQDLSWASIVAGRQRIQWGTGRVWNPTDLFNPINPASYDKIEKDGSDALSVKVHLGQFTDVQAVYNVRPTSDSSNYGARFRTNVSEFDLSAMGGWFDRKPVIGGDVAGNLLGAGIRGELAWTGESGDGWEEAQVRYILGADYQLNSDVYVMFEYLFNEAGVNDPAQYDLVRLYKGEIQNVNRKYLYLGTIWRMHPLVMGNAGFEVNINDGSGFLLLNATYSSSENTVLTTGMFLPLGEKSDEFWYYPTAFYVRGELHF